MHGWVDSKISAIILTLLIIVIVSLSFAHHMTLKINYTFKRNKKLGSRSGLFVDKKERFGVNYKSMLVTNTTCVICQNPTTRRCSRCKSIRYCSPECQVIHWREGHKNECHVPEANNTGHAINESEIICHNKHFETSKNSNPTTLLNPISLGLFKSNKRNLNGVDKKSLTIQSKNTLCNSLPINGGLPKPKRLFEWNGLNEPCGLINCGNSCFANVVLQCLTYTRPLAAYLLNGCHSEVCKRNDWCFICELQSHVHKVRHNQSPFSPIRILSRIRNIGNHLGYGRQEDAHEFMRFAIDSMQSICLDEVEVGRERDIDDATQETTLIHHMFGGRLQSQVKCMHCEHKSNRYESMMDLAVEIHGVVESLEDAIAQFTTSETLDGDNKYKCDCCNGYVKAQKRLTVHEAPNILTIALKRFQSGKFGKLNKRVTFPEVLNISPYMSGKNKIPLFYRLYAVVVHVDMLNASFFGHYICYVKDSNGIWYKIDDNKVKKVELEKVMAQRAYMLFYSRLEARIAPSIEGQPSEMITTSLLSSKIVHSPIHMESHRSSIFPPTIGTISVPTDLSKDFINNNELSELIFNEKSKKSYEMDIAEVKDEILDETKNENKMNSLVPTSTIVCTEEDIIKKISSSNNLTLPSASMICGSFDESSALETLNCGLSSNNEESELDLIVVRNDYNIGKEEPLHEHFPTCSATKGLNKDDLVECSMVDINHFNSQFDVENNKKLDGLYSPKLHSVKNNSTTCSPFSNLVEIKQVNSNEGDSWNDANFERNKQQTIEDNSKRLISTSASLNGDLVDMNIDGKNMFNVYDALESQPLFRMPFDDEISISLESLNTYKKHSNKKLLESSHVSSKLKSLSTDVDAKTYDSKSSSKINKDGIESKEQNKFSKNDFLFKEPYYQGHTFIEEPPNLGIDVKNKMSVTESTKSNIVIHEGSYDIRSLEDDVPYVVVEPFRNESSIPQFFKDTSLQQDVIQQSMEIFSMEMQDITSESANEMIPNDDTNSDVVVKEQCIIDISTMHNKLKKQDLKPLFFPGFLIKNSKFTLEKSSNPINNARIDKENIQYHYDEANEDFSDNRPTKLNPLNDKEIEDKNLNKSKKLDNHISSTGNYGNECGNENDRENGTENGNKKLEFERASRELPNNFGRENDISIFMDRSRNIKNMKQGRNDGCSCGSQQKWKKCCEKVIILKRGLITKQVKV